MNDRIGADEFRAAMSGSDLEGFFALQLRELGGTWVREHQFDPARGWRFDFAEIELQIAVEVEGHWGHRTELRYRADCAKYNAGALQGWLVLRGDADMVRTGALATAVTRALARRQVEQSRKSSVDGGAGLGPA